MKTLVDLEPELLEEAMKLGKKKTKRGTIQSALKEYVRTQHRERLRAMIASDPLDLTLEKLEQLRLDDESDSD